MANVEKLREGIEAVFRSLTAEQIIERLDTAQIANARMNTVQEFVDHPQLAARDRWHEVDSPVGPLRALLPPVTMEGFGTIMRAIPAVGQHTDRILEELDFDSETIHVLRESSVI